MTKKLRKFIMIFFFALGMITTQIILAQESKTVTGTVTDPGGMPLPGVTVKEKGTSNGVATDFDGNFSIDVVSNTSILEFSYVGMTTTEQVVGSQNSLVVKMQSDEQALDEVVLIGYGSQQRKAVSTAVTKVDTEDFNQGVVQSPLELIQGKVAGLQITRAGGNNPNGSTAIQLRGVTSLKGSMNPLIVIDGIPGGNLDLLQQNDIESFDVLKDGAAAAIYGTRGTNGVILITTKKGKNGVSTFNYSTFVSRDYVNSKPDFLSAAKTRALIAEGIISEDQDLGASTDIFDLLVNKTNLTQYHNFVASGGAKTSNYRASLYYKDSEGIAVENGRQEFGVRASFNQTGLDDKLTFSSSVAVNINDANLLGGGQFGAVNSWNPTAPIYAPFNNSVEGMLTNNGRYGFYQPENGFNPFSEYANRINQRKQLTFSGDVKLGYEFIPGLIGSVFGSYQRNSWDDRRYRSTQDYQQYTGEFNGTGFAYKASRLNFTQTVEPTLTFSKDFGDNSFELLGGYSYQYSTQEDYRMETGGFTTDGFLDWNFGAGNALTDDSLPNPVLTSFKEDNTLIAYFTRLSYSYKDRYFIQASVRHEGSSRFGANNKWASFPAISGAWVISDENFMQDASWLNNLKLRAGYGLTGNQGIPNYQSIVTLGGGGKYPIYDDAGTPTYYQTYGPVKNPNPDLRWETKKELNIGVDFGILYNKLSGSIDLYSRRTEDLLYDYTVPQPPFVRPTIFTNVGDITNKGIEVALNYRVVDQGDFKWSVDLVGSYQENELTSLSNERFSVAELPGGNLGNPGNLGNAILNTEGGPIGNFYGKRFAGFTVDGKWLFHKADGTIARADDMSPREDNAIIGNGLPKYFASFTNTFRYKNFDLTVLLRGKFKYDILNTVDMFYGNKKLLPGNILNSAVGKYNMIDESPQYSDYYLENGDFVKLDNLTLGYNFSLPDNSLFSALRIFGSARNLATFTGYTGRDPEVEDTGLNPGIDDRNNFYPRTITVTAGVNVNF